MYIKEDLLLLLQMLWSAPIQCPEPDAKKKQRIGIFFKSWVARKKDMRGENENPMLEPDVNEEEDSESFDIMCKHTYSFV